MAGSGGRIREFALRWSELNGGSEIIAFPKDDRFVTRYTAGVLFALHGMGMPSASIALQELMRDGVLPQARGPAGARRGVSGAGSAPAAESAARRHGRRQPEGLMADLRPYRLINGGVGEYWFDGHFPVATYDAIIAANEHTDFEIVSGKTVGQRVLFRAVPLDGAICLETPETKMGRLRWLHENGVANIEMEGDRRLSQSLGLRDSR